LVIRRETLIRFDSPSDAADILAAAVKLEGRDQRIHDVVWRLYYLLEAVAAGDTGAELQLRAIEKLLQPEKYDISGTDIEKVARIDRFSPQIARALELRKLMAQLSFAVEPTNTDKPFAVTAKVKVANEARPPGLPFWDNQTRFHKPGETLIDAARRHWNPKSSLQSLALGIYKEYLQGNAYTSDDDIDDSSLRRDLVALRRWEQSVTAQQRRWHILTLQGNETIRWSNDASDPKRR
jgi:hypothetical protein